jgi:murein DD-endopeptidase MepM/ murein hydrolase activator NlpD
MNREVKLTAGLLTFGFMCLIMYYINSQHRLLIDTIQTHEIELNEIINQHNTINTQYDSLLNIIDSLPLGSPLDTLKISSDYGWRRRPLSKGWQMHGGTDYLAAWHDTVYATGNGVVKKSRWNAGYGRCIIIDHAWGYQSTYAHLYRYFVRRGDTVQKGQPIARAGNSGAVTGPHLHYEVSRYGKRANPSLFMLDN